MNVIITNIECWHLHLCTLCLKFHSAEIAFALLFQIKHRQK